MADPKYVTGPPVGLLSARLPWESPQSLGSGWPHNLPPPIARPGQRQFQPVQGLGAPPAPSGPLGPSTPIDDKYRYAELSGEQIVVVGVASALVLVEPPNKRNLLILRNSSSGANIIFIAFGSSATLNSVIRLGSNTMVMWDTVVPQDEVYAVSDLASGQLTIAISNYVPGM